MPTRVTVASDDFNRASLGANWTQITTGGGNGTIEIDGSTTVVGGSSGADGNRQAARWDGAGAFANDQWSSLVITTLGNFGTSNSIGVCARASADLDGGRDYYEAVVLADSGGPNFTTVLAKVVNGAFTSLHSAAAAWAINDRIEIECEGTTIRVCKNGVPLGGSFTQVDASLATGKPGVAGAAGSGTAEGDNWLGGNFATEIPPGQSKNQSHLQDSGDGDFPSELDVKAWF